MEAKESVSALIGKSFTPKTGDINPLWMVVPNIDSVRTIVADWQTRFSSLEGKSLDKMSLFWELWPGDIDAQLRKMNDIAKEELDKKRQSRNNCRPTKWKPVSKQEFQTFISLFLAASTLDQKGKSLFKRDVHEHQLMFSYPS